MEYHSTIKIGRDCFLNTVITILIAILVFGLLIFIHELGHFLMAKSVGIRVNEFALGMGPVIFKFHKKDTQYSLRLFPIGGYVSMEGEDVDSADNSAFCNKKVWQRVLVVVTGAIMNILLGFIIMIGLTMSQELLSTTVVSQFNEGATSSQVLQQGDEVKRVNGAKVHTVNDIVFELIRDKDGKVDMEVIRGENAVELTAIPFQMQTYEDGTNAIQLDFKVFGKEKTFFGVLQESYYWTIAIVKQVWVALIELVTGQYNVNQLSGPVGVTSAIGQASSMGIQSLMLMVAFITINIGVFNLLPLPALDGGRLVFLIIEGIRRKPVPPKYEGYVHAAGFALLIGLMIFVTFNDIVRIFKG